MSIILLGLNYKSATVEIREKVSMSKSNIQRNAETLRQLEAVDGIAILSTCNRTEFYLDGADDEVAVNSMLQFISAYSDCSVDSLNYEHSCRARRGLF